VAAHPRGHPPSGSCIFGGLGIQLLYLEAIAKPPESLCANVAIPEKCASDAHVSGKAGGFAIISLDKRNALPFDISLPVTWH
jgi:hypothetical protein